MATGSVSRRQFARSLAAGAAAALVSPKLVESLPAAMLPPGLPATTIQLNANENPYGPSARAREAITASESTCCRYPLATDAELVDALAHLNGVKPDNILLGCGSTEILRATDMAFLSPEKNVVVAEPTFEAVLEFARITRARPVKVPLTSDFRHDLPRMAAACDGRTGVAYVCNPSNPTATIVTRDELGEFFRRVPRSTTILVDEAYIHFVEDQRFACSCDWLGSVPNLVIARTFSKIYGMAGMRLGYAISSRENIAAMRQHIMWRSANAAVIAAALASLGDDEHVADQKKRLNGTRRWLMGEMKKDGRPVIPSEANFVMIDMRGDVEPVIQGFADRGILVGRKFASMPNWLRVSVGKPEEMERFVSVLREIVPARA